MTLRVSGKSINIGEAIRGRVAGRTEEVLRKYFDGNYSGHFTFSKDGFGFKADCSLHLDSGVTLEADAMAQIEKRLRRYKSRLKDRSARKAHAESEAMAAIALDGIDASSYVLEGPSYDDGEDSEVTAFNPVVIAESTHTLRRFSVSEAVMELDMTGAPVIVFQHGSSGRVNIIYRRSDGNVGWIDPPAAK